MNLQLGHHYEYPNFRGTRAFSQGLSYSVIDFSKRQPLKSQTPLIITDIVFLIRDCLRPRFVELLYKSTKRQTHEQVVITKVGTPLDSCKQVELFNYFFFFSFYNEIKHFIDIIVYIPCTAPGPKVSICYTFVFFLILTYHLVHIQIYIVLLEYY